MPRVRIPCPLLCVAAAALFAGPARAQAPTVGFVFPSGGRAGIKSTVNVNGGNLQGATAVLVSGEGVKATLGNNSNAGSLPVELDVTPNAVPGPRELRIVTPRGTSNAGRLWVGTYPEANETEPNNALSAAMKLEKLPAIVNGQINGAEDTDSYAFQAAAGDTFVFDLVAYRIGSELDGYLSLFDSRGKILQSAQEPFDRDPRIVHTFKSAGTYTVQVRDSMYRGGGNYVYQLTLGKLPVITGYLPRAGKRGQTVNVTVEGANLGSMKSMPVQIPMEARTVEMIPSTPMGPAVNAISLEASEMNEAVEVEPNDTPAQANPLGGAPVAVSGRIDRHVDVDYYRFKPTAAANLTFDLFARRIGSRIDSKLSILDAAGKVLQSNDDADGKDSRLTLGVQANTEDLIQVEAQDQNTGGDAFYRLEIRLPATPDFRLQVSPDSINIGQGGSTLVTATVQRLNGFGGPVELRLEGLPAGLTASPAMIAQGAQNAQFTITADPTAAPAAMGKIRIIGKATIADKVVEREAVGTEGYNIPLAPQEQGKPLPQRPTQILTATASAPTPYALTVAPEGRAITVKRGASAMIKVTAIRQMGQTAQINLTAAGQPANVTPALQNVAANQNEATITLNVAAGAPVGKYNVIISGDLNKNVQVAPAITLTIVE